MSLSDFLSPISFNSAQDNLYTSHLGSKIEMYHTDFPDLDTETFDLAIIGVQEDRNATGNTGTALSAEYFREKFYSLNPTAARRNCAPATAPNSPAFASPDGAKRKPSSCTGFSRASPPKTPKRARQPLVSARGVRREAPPLAGPRAPTPGQLVA